MRKNERHQRQSGEELSLDERKSFVFLGGNLALDLVNTEIRVRGKREDVLVTPHDAALWWNMAQQMYPQDIQDQGERAWNEQEVAALHALRRTLRHVFEAVAAHRQVQEHDVQELNAVLREGYYALNLSPEGEMSARYQARQGTKGSAELSIAFAALSLLTQQDLSRLHACQNEKCTLLFYDRTRSATRHWCSIACTNRARSRQHYRQAKGVSLL